MLYLHEPEAMSLTEYKWSLLDDRKRAETDILYFVLNLVKVFREDEVTGCSKMSKKAEEGKGR